MPRAHPPHLRPVEALDNPEPAAGVLEALATSGDVDAWSALYERHYTTVFRQVRYLCGDLGLAEELTQESFAQGMASCRRYDGRRAFASWMHGIALNVVRKHWRKQNNRSRAMERYQHLGEAGARAEDPDGTHLRRERSRALYEVLDELPPRWREAFTLREIQGLSTSETAERLGISTSNVAVRVTRARGRIRDELSRRGWFDDSAVRAVR